MALRTKGKIEICNSNTNNCFLFCPNGFFNVSSCGTAKLGFFICFMFFLFSGAPAAQTNKSRTWRWKSEKICKISRTTYVCKAQRGNKQKPLQNKGKIHMYNCESNYVIRNECVRHRTNDRNGTVPVCPCALAEITIQH